MKSKVNKIEKPKFIDEYHSLDDKIKFLQSFDLVNLQKAAKIGNIPSSKLKTRRSAIKSILAFDLKNKFLICQNIFNNLSEYYKEKVDDVYTFKTIEWNQYEYDQRKTQEWEIIKDDLKKDNKIFLNQFNINAQNITIPIGSLPEKEKKALFSNLDSHLKNSAIYSDNIENISNNIENTNERIVNLVSQNKKVNTAAKKNTKAKTIKKINEKVKSTIETKSKKTKSSINNIKINSSTSNKNKKEKTEDSIINNNLKENIFDYTILEQQNIDNKIKLDTIHQSLSNINKDLSKISLIERELLQQKDILNYIESNIGNFIDNSNKVIVSKIDSNKDVMNSLEKHLNEILNNINKNSISIQNIIDKNKDILSIIEVNNKSLSKNNDVSANKLYGNLHKCCNRYKFKTTNEEKLNIQNSINNEFIKEQNKHRDIIIKLWKDYESNKQKTKIDKSFSIIKKEIAKTHKLLINNTDTLKKDKVYSQILNRVQELKDQNEKLFKENNLLRSNFMSKNSFNLKIIKKIINTTSLK